MALSLDICYHVYHFLGCVCVCERVCAFMYMCMHRLNLLKIKAVGYFIKYNVFACMLFFLSNLQIKLRKSYK